MHGFNQVDGGKVADLADLLDKAEAGALPMREGLWDIWSCISWISSRSTNFVAAVQHYSEASIGPRAGSDEIAVWLVLDDVSSEMFGISFGAAADLFRVSLEADKIRGIAKNVGSGVSEEIPWIRWSDWDLDFSDNMSPLIGYTHFRWPSTEVQAAFGGTQTSAAPKVERAPPFKAGRGPDDSALLAKADEMRARGMRSRDIASKMRLEPGFENVETTHLRKILGDRWPRPGRGGIKAQNSANEIAHMRK